MNLPVFSLENTWNEVVGTRQDRIVKPRNYIYAGEVGGPLIDTWLKMKGEEPSNKPNSRSLRKFFAGDVWEDITKIVLASAGILIRTQEQLEYQYEGLCPVHGRLDLYAGGIPNSEKVERYFNGMKSLNNELYQDENPYDDSLESIAYRVAEQLKAKFPAGFEKIILEIKSSSTFMFEARVKRNKPDLHHALQLFHYLKAKNEDRGVIVYVNRDDAMIKEFYIFKDDAELEKEYRRRIENISHYYLTNEQPPLEKEILWNPDMIKFEKNWAVEYSNYLTKLYGYSEPESYREMWDKRIAGFNRVFKRALQISMGATTPTGKPMLMTPQNLEVVKELKGFFPNFDDLLVDAKNKVKSDPTLAVEESEGE